MRLFLIWMSLLIALSAHAEDDIKYGFSPNLSLLSLSDPDGSAGQVAKFSFFSGIAKYKGPLRYSYWISEFGYQSFSLDASTSEIGQNSTRWNFAGGYEHRVPVARNFEFYAGALLGISQSEYASRHTVDSDGFLASTFSKRSGTEPYIKVQAAWYMDINKDWEFGLIPAYEYAFGDGFSGLSLSAAFLY